jgi:hypothetical protein
VEVYVYTIEYGAYVKIVMEEAFVVMIHIDKNVKIVIQTNI